MSINLLFCIIMSLINPFNILPYFVFKLKINKNVGMLKTKNENLTKNNNKILLKNDKKKLIENMKISQKCNK